MDASVAFDDMSNRWTSQWGSGDQQYKHYGCNDFWVYMKYFVSEVQHITFYPDEDEIEIYYVSSGEELYTIVMKPSVAFLYYLWKKFIPIQDCLQVYVQRSEDIKQQFNGKIRYHFKPNDELRIWITNMVLSAKAD